jgi:tetratricopeptide (TPR) repeat protein
MLEHFSRWLRRYKGIEANPVYRLAVEVATGKMTFEKALAGVQSYNVISGLADGDLIELDRQAEFEARTNFEFGLLLSQLNAAAARAKGFEKVYVDLCLRVADLFESVARLPERDYYLREAVKAAQRTSYVVGQRRVTGRLARQAFERGDRLEARRLWTAQLEAGREDADGKEEVETALHLANLAMNEGDSATAYDLYHRAGKSARRLGMHAEVVESLLAQVTISRERGEMQSALMLLRQAEEAADRTVDTRLKGQVAYRTGALLCDLNRPTEALPLLESAIENARQESDIEIETRALGLLANIEQQSGNREDARGHYERLVALEGQTGNRIEAGRAMCQLGTLHFEGNRLDDALRVLNDAREIAATAQDQDFTIQVHGLLGSVLAAQGRERDALEALEVAVSGSHQAGDYLSEARWLVAAGEAMLRFGGPDEAESLADQAYSLARQENDQVLRAQVYALNGQIALVRGSIDGATDAYASAVAAVRAGGYPDEALQYLPLLARLTVETGDVPQALIYLGEAIDLAEESDELRTLCSLLGQTARLHQRAGAYEQAVEFYERTLEAARRLEDHALIARALQGLATSLDSAGRLHEAIDNYRLAIDSAERAHDARATARIHYNLGAIYADDGKDDQARRYLVRARDVAESIGDYDLADLAANLLAILSPTGAYFDSDPEDFKLSEEPARPRDYPTLH